MKLKKTSIRDQVYAIVKEKILKKDFKLGECINIQELTREFSVSNSPIREALSSLNAIGLIEFSDNYGYKVVSLSDKEIIDLNEAVLNLILGSLNIINKKNKICHLENLLEKAYNKHLNKYKESGNFDYEYIKTSINFDKQFVLATDNKYMIKEFNDLSDLLILSSIYNKKIYKDIHLEEHKLILEKINKKDLIGTEEIIKNHFNKKIKDMDYD